MRVLRAVGRIATFRDLGNPVLSREEKIAIVLMALAVNAVILSLWLWG